MKRIAMFGAVVGLALTALLAAESKKADVLLQAGMAKETVQGDLKGAIAQYEQAVKEAGANRALAAQALVRMADCYQKLGDAESKKIYERLIREYSDQQESFGIARARLGDRGMGSAPTDGIALRKVWVGDIDGTTPDGRWLSYVDSATGNLALHDLDTGADRTITVDGSWFGNFAGESAISRDRTQVAYMWFDLKADRYELRLASLAGSRVPQSRRLFASEDVTGIVPLDWSPDGRSLAVAVQRQDRTGQIGLLAVPAGSLRILKTVDWRGPSKAVFSPDGRLLAYDLPAGDRSTERDVFVLAVDGSREVAAVVSPAQDVVMGWSPDGKRLLFASDRNGSMGVWGLTFADGKANGTPDLLQANVGNVRSLGITDRGALYLGIALSGRDIEMASIDFNTGMSIAPKVRPIQSYIGTNRWLDWSRDGRYLAYVSERGRDGSDSVIAIRDMVTGNLVRELVPRFRYFQGLSWSPDGRTFAVGATDLKGRDGVFGINAETGETTPLALSPETRGFGGFRPEWSPDGKRIYYSIPTASAPTFAIVELDITSGKQRNVTVRNDPGIISLSPDGRWIASGAVDSSTDQSPVVVLIPVDGGEPRQLIRANEPQSFARNMGWTPDGRGLIVRKLLTKRGDTSELWLVPIGSGQPIKLDVDVNRIGPLSPIRVHPDGRRLAFFSFMEQRGSEVWVLENFLKASR